MEQLFLNFYRSFYLRTGGFIPSKPLNRNVYPGDFFQVRNGEMIVLGNIFRNGIVNPQECILRYGIKQDPAGWTLSYGTAKPFSGHGSSEGSLEGESLFSRQVMEFDGAGTFSFKGHDPESARIMNWSDLQQQLIIKLTQTVYSFRELYVVTESAAASHWVLAIAGAKGAEVEIATESETADFLDIFGHQSSRVVRLKDMAFFHREPNRKPEFFKAKKLAVQNERVEVFISELICQRKGWNDWVSNFYSNDFYCEPGGAPQVHGNTQAGVLDMLQSGELNPNTALRYFTWADASLDDVEKLFFHNG